LVDEPPNIGDSLLRLFWCSVTDREVLGECAMSNKTLAINREKMKGNVNRSSGTDGRTSDRHEPKES
jgi:hypothetical protein